MRLRRRRRIPHKELMDAIYYVVEQCNMPYEVRREEMQSYGLDFDQVSELVSEVFDSDDQRQAFGAGFLLALRLAP